MTNPAYPPFHTQVFPQEADQLANWIVARAAREGEWPMEQHQTFLEAIGRAVSDATGRQLLLELPPDAPSDYHFIPDTALEVPCTTQIAPFEHAIDADSDPAETAPDPDLLARGKQLCSTCIVQAECLTYGVSPPELKDGLYGGHTKAERLDAWQQNLDERLNQLGAIYTNAGNVLLRHINKPGGKQAEKLYGALAPLAGQLVTQTDLEAKAENKQLDPEIQDLLTNQKVVERAAYLLPSLAREVMRHWIAACQNGGDPFAYDFETKAQTLKKNEEIVKSTLVDLTGGNFNYRRWVRMRDSKDGRNAIVFLVAIGEEVPDGDIENLKKVAQEKLRLLSSVRLRGVRKHLNAKDLLSESYGLGENAPANNQAIMQKYGVSRGWLDDMFFNELRKLRALLGNTPQDEL